MYRRHADQPTGLNVAALPDLIFTVLFFFMVVTTMRSVERRLAVTVPAGTELTSPDRQLHLIYIYARAREGDAPHIQVNDRLCSLDQVGDEVSRLRRAMSAADARRLTVVLSADRHTDMGTVTAIKQALRRADATHVVYAATQRPADPDLSPR